MERVDTLLDGVEHPPMGTLAERCKGQHSLLPIIVEVGPLFHLLKYALLGVVAQGSAVEIAAGQW